MKATVVVVNWNRKDLILPCLESLTHQTLPRDHWQVWVVDNASTDGSQELIESEHPWVRLLRNPDNRGFAGGNNTALREVTTPFAVLLNNDATPEPDWLEKLLAPFEDEPELGATASKILFMPRFARLSVATTGFTPGAHDTRELGVRIHSVTLDGHEVADHILWERFTYGLENGPGSGFRWTRPSGELLLPLDHGRSVEITWAAEADKDVTISWAGGSVTLPVTADGNTVSFELPANLETVDVINNVGGVVFVEGYGADRGFQQVDEGQYETPEPVFTGCGNGAAIRSEIGHELGWFDDDFFLYYEDTDFFWRMRSRGHEIRYEPTAVLRHIHSASTGESSPVFQFHVARNRLLMLTKCASARLALTQVLRYVLTTLSMLRNGHKRAVLMRTKAFLSYLRLLPKMLVRRGTFRRKATVSRTELEKWLVRP